MQDIVTSYGTVRVEVTTKQGMQLAHWGGVGAIYATLTYESVAYLCRGTAEFYPPTDQWSMTTPNSVMVADGEIPAEIEETLCLAVEAAVNASVPMEAELEDSRRREILNRRHENDLQITKQETGREDREQVRIQLDLELLPS